MSLAGLFSVVIPGPCGWVVCRPFACYIFESWEPSFVEFQTFLFFAEVLLILVDFNGFLVQSDVVIACCPVFQYFEIEFHIQLVLGHVQLLQIFLVVLVCSVSHVL